MISGDWHFAPAQPDDVTVDGASGGFDQTLKKLALFFPEALARQVGKDDQ